MRNLRKRRKLIRQMEQANKIPDKLMPQEIKDMLDVAGFRPVIENTPNSAEIKINSGRSNALRCLAVVAAFVLFRAFDIAKPLGIRKMESLRGGVGVMMDDILAGVYSFILLAGVRCVIG